MSSSCCSVFTRVRPRIKGGNALHSSEWHHPDAVTRNGENNVIISESRDSASGSSDLRSQEFIFDGIFDQDSTQEEVYEVAALDAIDAVTGPTACSMTVFAYGQTGSGKTWSTLGKIKDTRSGGRGTTTAAKDDADNSPICPESGILLRALQDLLVYQKAQEQQGIFKVILTISVLEVYLDSARDLLAKDPGAELKVVIVDDSVQIPELTYREVTSLQDVVKAYNDASRRRVSRATDANDASSRSHAIFNIDVFRIPLVSLSSITGSNFTAAAAAKKDDGGGESGGDSRSTSNANASPASPASPATPAPGMRVVPTVADIIASRNQRKSTPVPSSVQNCGLFPNSNIMMVRPGPTPTNAKPSLVPVFHSRVGLVDLAGSEKMKSVNSKGEALEEMKKINGSLTALGNVVHSLHANSKHVPYRDSRLTVLLRDGFASPGAKIVLIANIAPTSVCHDESLSTLLFANKVKAMKADRGAGGGGSAAELALQAQLTDVLKKFDACACDLRIWSASLSPSDDRTAALRMLRDQHLAAVPSEKIGVAVREMAEQSKAQRSADAERAAKEQPQRELEEYRAKCDEQRAILQRHAGGKGSVQELIAQIEKELPALVQELEARHPEVALHEAKLREHGDTHKSLDAELREAEERLQKLSIITDPETLQIKAEASEESKAMEKHEEMHEAVSPCFDLLKMRGATVGTLVSVFEDQHVLLEEIARAEALRVRELKKVDPESVRVRTELLSDQFEDEMLASPWLTRQQSSVLFNRGSGSPKSEGGSPTAASPLGRSQSVGLAASPTKIDNFFASSLASSTRAPLGGGPGADGRSASVGIFAGGGSSGGGKLPPPPPPIFDKSGKQVRYPAVGKKIIPPPPVAVGEGKKIAPALAKFLHFPPASPADGRSASAAVLSSSSSASTFSAAGARGGGNGGGSATEPFADAVGRSQSAAFSPGPRLAIPKAPPPPPPAPKLLEDGGEGRSVSVGKAPPPPPPPPPARSGSVAQILASRSGSVSAAAAAADGSSPELLGRSGSAAVVMAPPMPALPPPGNGSPAGKPPVASPSAAPDGPGTRSVFMSSPKRKMPPGPGNRPRSGNASPGNASRSGSGSGNTFVDPNATPAGSGSPKANAPDAAGNNSNPNATGEVSSSGDGFVVREIG